ncbi:hypothetical protein HZA56_10600 [Candidatus Poribacteria bacterium]|nr:hypothetical protein [Candidatus Poribacteria bacterium]
MKHPGIPHAAKWVILLLMALTLLPGCGHGRKKYLEQVVPIVEQNDAVDARFSQLPRINAFQDPNYLPTLDSCIGEKQGLLGRLEIMQPPFLMATTHAKLIQAMKNGIRYLQSEREKFVIAARKMAQMPPPVPQGSEEMEIVREYQSQTSAYQADMREQLMKQQYEKLYDEVRDELERAKKL